jgi:DnaJ-class molecular chaperone
MCDESLSDVTAAVTTECVTQIHPEDSFTRQGCDVYSTVPIAYTDAILGAKLDVQTLRGTTAIQVAPGTQHNTTLRLSQQGVQAWGSTSAMFGSHYVTLHVLIPLECTAEEQQLLERIQRTARTFSGTEPAPGGVAPDTNSSCAAAYVA